MHHGPELHTVVICCLALAVGALTRTISKRTGFPYTVAMLGLGLASGIALKVSEIEAPIVELLTSDHLVSPDLIIFVFLPALIFESAFALDVHAFRKNLAFVLVLALPALLIATVASAGWMHFVTAETLGISDWDWSWRAALVFGALISATDPVAVVAILREVGAPKRLGLLIEGESLLNDGTAIVVFGVLVGLLAGGSFDLGHTLLELVRVAGGGVALGLALAWVTGSWLARTFDDALVEITLTIVLAYAAMILAESVLHVSGVLAIVTAGIYLAGPGRTRISSGVAHFLHRFWEMLAYLANTVIFLLVGFLIATHLHLARASTLGVIVLGFVGLVAIRFVIVFAARPIANRFVDQPVDVASAITMSWGGLRGAVSLALALLLTQHPAVDEALGVQILTVTAGIVLLTIGVNGTTTGWLLDRLGLTHVGAAEALAEAQASRRVLSIVSEQVEDAASDPSLRTVPWQSVRAELAERTRRTDAELERAVDASEREGARARTAGMWRRAIRVERRFYRCAYTDGTLGAPALARLDLELDEHLDSVEADDLEAPPTRLAEPGWAAATERWVRRLGLPFGRMAFQRVSLRYDLARVVAEAASRVRDELARLREHDAEAVDAISEVYRRYGAEARHVLEDLRLHMPELTTAIETRLAERIALSFEQGALKGLVHEGAIGDAVAERKSAELKQRAKRLYFSATRTDLPETATLCRETALFIGLDEEVIEELARMTIEQAFARGEMIFARGDKGDGMYIVARGVVEVFQPASTEDDEELLGVLGGGDVLGEMALLTDEPRSASARAATAVTVGRISRRDFRQLMETRPGVQHKIWRAFAERSLDNRLRAGLLGRLSGERRRELVATSRELLLEAGEGMVVAGGGLFVVDGMIEAGDSTYAAGSRVRAGLSCTARVTSRLLQLSETARQSSDAV